MGLSVAKTMQALEGGAELLLTLPENGKRSEQREYSLSTGGAVSRRTVDAIIDRLEVSQPSLFPDAPPQAYRLRNDT